MLFVYIADRFHRAVQCLRVCCKSQRGTGSEIGETLAHRAICLRVDGVAETLEQRIHDVVDNSRAFKAPAGETAVINSTFSCMVFLQQ